MHDFLTVKRTPRRQPIGAAPLQLESPHLEEFQVDDNWHVLTQGFTGSGEEGLGGFLRKSAIAHDSGDGIPEGFGVVADDSKDV